MRQQMMIAAGLGVLGLLLACIRLCAGNTRGSNGP